MTEELYEELPENPPEEIYEDLPEGPYNDMPSSPPPLPTTPIPSIASPAHKPHPPAVPPIPTRSAATTITSNTLPSNNNLKPVKQAKAATLKTGKQVKPPPPKPKGGGGGGGGIDMSEIMKKARSQSRSAIMDLETKIGEKRDDDSPHVAPWAKQLRKPKVPAKEVGENGVQEGSAPSWVKRKSPVVEEQEEVPEFIRKRKEIQAQLDVEDTKSSAPPPPVASKPATVVPTASQNGTPPALPGPSDDNKPAWLRQRERQEFLAKNIPVDKPATVPKPATKPPPMAPKPSTNKPAPTPLPVKTTPEQPPPLSPRKQRPVPVPRASSTQDLFTAPSSEETTSPSVMEKAKMFTDAAKPAVTPKVAAKPPPLKPTTEPPASPSPRIEKKSPTPPPIPTRDSSIARSAQPAAVQRTPSPIREEVPPPPASRPPPSADALPPPPPPPPPDAPPPPLPPNMPPPPSVPPPPSSHPPSSKPPPPSSNAPPALPQRNSPKPPPPSPPAASRPPPSLPATKAQPTPPTGTVSKFRRLPLQSVNLLSPPPVPARSSKPAKFPAPPVPPPPVANGSEIETDDGPEEIYEDTIMATEHPEEEEQDLYDDVSQLQQQPNPGPPAASMISPQLPTGPPPKIRPPLPSPEFNYEKDPSLQQNGTTHDEPQEVYEDLHPDDSYLTSPAPPTPSTLLPPSPSQSSLTPSQSPSLERKQKLSKEQKKLQKEEEKKKKEMKKREEIRVKNRQKALKIFKEFKLPNNVEPLFPVEITEDHAKGKDHMAVAKGEMCFVMLLNHPKLPDDHYFIEKEDGTMGYVMKSIALRTAYKAPESEVTPIEPDMDFGDDKDIYESLPAAEEDDGFGIAPPPALPPPNPGNLPPQRFPAPSQPPPPPPGDEPQDNYEYLPEPAEGQGSY